MGAIGGVGVRGLITGGGASGDALDTILGNIASGSGSGGVGDGEAAEGEGEGDVDAEADAAATLEL